MNKVDLVTMKYGMPESSGEVFREWYKCPKCQSIILETGFVFCPKCGVSVHWMPLDTSDTDDLLISKDDIVLTSIAMVARREFSRLHRFKPRDVNGQITQWRHILRLCEKAGVTSSCLREEKQ